MRVAPGAYRWAAVPALVGGVAGVAYPPVAAAGLLLALGALLFFRDPDRVPQGSGVISPADGTVSVIRTEETDDGNRVRVGVFMNVWHVHVNRAPVGGRVQAVTHEPGAHRPAFTKDSERNERVRVRLDGEDGEFEVVQIAGAFARRITSYLDAGNELARGDRIGHIAFGSRADVLLPPAFDRGDIAVEEGDSVRAGESVLAER
jgi:phosphatidylserine decarboxylase